MIRILLAALGGAGLTAAIGWTQPKPTGCFTEQLSADSVMVMMRPCYVPPGDSVMAYTWRTHSPHRFCDVQIILNLESEVMQVEQGRCRAVAPGSLQVSEPAPPRLRAQ